MMKEKKSICRIQYLYCQVHASYEIGKAVPPSRWGPLRVGRAQKIAAGGVTKGGGERAF